MNNIDLFDYLLSILNLSDNDDVSKLEILSYKVLGGAVDYADFLKSFDINYIRNEIYDYYFILDKNINSVSICSTYYFNTSFNNKFELIYEIDIMTSEILEETDDYIIFKCLSPNFLNCDNRIEFTLKLNKLIKCGD